MVSRTRSVLVIGAGAFGLAAAYGLRQRGWSVTVCDAGPIPHPHASSTDISKAVRMDYGSDLHYTEMAELALDGWRRWDRDWGGSLFHPDGFLIMRQRPLRAGDFEYDGWELLTQRGVPVERIDSAALAERFPAWNAGAYPDGYLNPTGGWVESARAVARLAAQSRSIGVTLRERMRCEGLRERGGRIVGARFANAEVVEADLTIVATGAWTASLVPWLADRLTTVGQPVLHFRPCDPELFRGERFPVWGADISSTGWYGFPLTAAGIVKVGHHGAGIAVDPHLPPDVSAEHEQRCREFLRHAFPALADAPRVSGRVCLYCDSFDGNFLIDHDPQRPGLMIASGGSGHGFKFAPLFVDLIPAVAERRDNRWAHRFRWRELGDARSEQARCVPARGK